VLQTNETQSISSDLQSSKTAYHQPAKPYTKSIKIGTSKKKHNNPQSKTNTTTRLREQIEIIRTREHGKDEEQTTKA